MSSFIELKSALGLFERANRRHALIARGDSILVALSGGPDSTALLYLLLRLSRKNRLSLFAAHLDHNLSSEGRRRAAFCERLCAGWGVPLVSGRLRTRPEGEDAARRARYAFLRAAAEKTGAKKIATGHTLDDQAETVLLRVLRGAGLKGLGGIPPKRMEGKYPVVRPFLGTPKTKVLALLREAKVPFRRDPANKDRALTRNRVRRLLPSLERDFNPRAKESLAALADSCRDAQEALARTGAKALKRASAKARPGRVRLRIGILRTLHPAVMAETLMQAWEVSSAQPRRPKATHLAALVDLVGGGQDGETGLPMGFRARRSGEWLELAGKPGRR